jgi:CRP-like cAMP-binding protein
MVDLRKLKDKAAELAAKGKLEKAAGVYREVLQADPKDVGIRQKLAEVLRRAGEVPEAVARYAEVAERFARDGLLIKAIAICKTILELDPSHDATQSMLAELYGQRAKADGARPPPRTMFLKAVAPPAPAPVEIEEEDEAVAIRLAPAAAPPAPAPPTEPAIELSPELQPPELEPEPEPEEAPAEDVPISFDEPAEPADPFATWAPPPPPRPARTISLTSLPAVPPPSETAFTLIMSAAEGAVEAGVEETIFIDPDLDEDAGPVAGDEPASVEEALAELPADAVEPIEEPSDPRLPRVPLFSDLGHEAFVALTQGMELHRFKAGEPVLLEGDFGTSFFVVASGRFTVSKRDPTGQPVALAHLGDGDFFGEMAMLSGAPRGATVTAEGPAEVLEIPAGVLQRIAGAHPHVADSLRRFYRQRLLANAMAVSPIFSPFGKGERKLIIERFRTREVAAGEVVIKEGYPSDGLYVILDGVIDVTKRKDGADVMAGQLREGDLFGEVSCLRKTPATSTVTARRAGTLLRLPRAEFDELVMSYPQILELLSTLSDERLESLDAIVTGHAEYTDEGLVLI